MMNTRNVFNAMIDALREHNDIVREYNDERDDWAEQLRSVVSEFEDKQSKIGDAASEASEAIGTAAERLAEFFRPYLTTEKLEGAGIKPVTGVTVIDTIEHYLLNYPTQVGTLLGATDEVIDGLKQLASALSTLEDVEIDDGGCLEQDGDEFTEATSFDDAADTEVEVGRLVTLLYRTTPALTFIDTELAAREAEAKEAAEEAARKAAAEAEAKAEAERKAALAEPEATDEQKEIVSLRDRIAELEIENAELRVEIEALNRKFAALRDALGV